MISITGAFVTKWYEQLKLAEGMAGKGGYRESYGDRHRAVQYFLDAMKYELAEVLFPEVMLGGAGLRCRGHPPSRIRLTLSTSCSTFIYRGNGNETGNCDSLGTADGQGNRLRPAGRSGENHVGHLGGSERARIQTGRQDNDFS